MTIEERIHAIEQRNKAVEENKARETSTVRKVAITALTYITIVLFFWSADLPQPFINAIVPSLGFLLSTLSLPFLRKLWEKNNIASD